MGKKKPPPVASIPKRNHEDVNSWDDLDLATPESKRRRRFFEHEGRETTGHVGKLIGEGQETEPSTSKSSDLMTSKVLANLDDKEFQRLLDLYSPKAKVALNDGQEMSGEDREVRTSTLAMSDSSEDELVVQDENANTRNSDVEGENAALPPNPPGVHGPDYNHDLRINIAPNTVMRDKFREYCQRMRKMNPTFSKSQKRALALLAILKGTSAALGTYDKILEWHHRDKGDVKEFESLKYVANYQSRSKMFKFLDERYFLTDKKAKTASINLPHSKAKVELTFHNAWDCIESLLTDPRVQDQDYLFHGNDPFAPPPPVTANSMINELNSGKAYYAAYQKFIKFPGKQVLLPIVAYIDGAATAQFCDLPVTALKIALGIHNRTHRNREMAWRTLGYVAQVSKAAGSAKDILNQSDHMEADNERLQEDDFVDDATTTACKAQDFHTMLDFLLLSYVEVQNNGFIWDLRYRGKTYEDVEFVPFVMYIKCDTEEGDLLCGSYTNRMKHVAQLCRYCCCPTDESDLVYAEYPKKTVEMVQKLVEARNTKALKRLSQQNIQNAWYKIRFHPYTDQGIHGACPSEMLHALLLGVFSYTRDCFFDQIGKTSKVAIGINGLAKKYGDFFQRQSERDAPKCQFKKGIIRGKTTAKEFVGIMLIIAVVLRSDKGRALLSKRRETFGDPDFYRDWVNLVEHLLEWEAFLNEPEMLVRHVIRLRMKHRYIMYLIKKVLNRTVGMGLKLTKVHMILHMWSDIYLYSVPSEVDTGTNESQHKKSKVAAKLTQRNEATFDYQTCTRLDEFFAIELSIAETKQGRKMWDYFRKKADFVEPDQNPGPPRTGGTVITVFEKDKKIVFSTGTGKKSRVPLDLPWNDVLVEFLFELQFKLGIDCLKIRGEHTREGFLFRGNPSYRSRQWKDWATFEWENEELPGQIWCFVIIDFEPGRTIQHGGIEVKKGTYAVIENATYDPRDSEKKKSDIFVPIIKEVERPTREHPERRRKFYLADVEAITNTLMVIPNIGGPTGKEYFVMKQESEWVSIFKNWIDDEHSKDIIPITEKMPRFNCFGTQTNT